MELFIGQLLSGLAAGGIYACIALALTVTYRATRVLNFAQGEMAMLGTYFAWFLIGHSFNFWLASMTAITCSFIFGAAIQLILIRPIERDPIINQVVVTIGLLLIINSLSGAIFGFETIAFPSPFENKTLEVLKYELSLSDLGTFLFALLAVGLVFVFFGFSKVGLVMRGVAQNQTSARLLGIRVRIILAVSWGLAAAIGTAACILAAPTLYLSPNMMRGAIIYGIAAAILGGLESPGGAAVSGIFLGVLENILGTYVPFIGSSLKMTVALVITLVILLIRPNGVFGKAEIKRV